MGQVVRVRLISAAAITAFCGVLTRFTGIALIQDHLGGTFYVAFLCIVARFARPGMCAWSAAVLATAIASVVEASQMLDGTLLSAIRSHPIGAAAIGSHFDLYDFPFYVLGGILGYAVVRAPERPGGHRVETDGDREEA